MKTARASKADVEAFIAQRKVAVAGLSRSGQAFSNLAYGEMKARGYELCPVNPAPDSIGGEKCYRSLAELSGKAKAAIVFTSPSATAGVVREAAAAGFERLWIQQGAESPEALEAARSAGIPCVAGQCILMHLENAGSIHRVHRFFARLFGSAPK